MRYRTLDFEFDTATGEVLRNGVVHRLEPQPCALLTLLMSRPGELVTRPEAIGALWGDHTSVNFQDGLNYSVRQIRLALGDRAHQPSYVETIPRRGYRFIAAAERPAQVREPLTSAPRTRAWAAAAVVILLMAATTAAVERRPNRHHEIAVAILRAVHDRLF